MEKPFFSKRLNALMKQFEWTQSSLAREIGSERQRVGNWVHGRSVPDMETIRQIAAAMKVPVSEFYEDPRPGEIDISSFVVVCREISSAYEALARAMRVLEQQANVLGVSCGANKDCQQG